MMYRIQKGEAYSGCIPITVWFVQVKRKTRFGYEWVNVKGFDKTRNGREVVEHLKVKVEMEKQIHPLIAKYAGSIDSKLNIKLSEEEIKEQEQEFERIKNFLENHDIQRLHSILFTQTESNNET